MLGQKIGRLTVVGEGVPRGKRQRVTWRCLCECGIEIDVLGDTLRNGMTKSCGCLRRETTAARSRTHGHSVDRKESRELKSYNHAKSRCTNPNDPKYPQYGGRGIKMCQQWLDAPAAFLRDMGPAPAGHTIDRIDVNGDYEPSNCVWADSMQQARHRRDNVSVEWDGRSWILKDLAAHLGVDYKSLHAYHRGKRKLPIAEAIAAARKL